MMEPFSTSRKLVIYPHVSLAHAAEVIKNYATKYANRPDRQVVTYKCSYGEGQPFWLAVYTTPTSLVVQRMHVNDYVAEMPAL